MIKLMIVSQKDIGNMLLQNSLLRCVKLFGIWS